VKSSGVFNRAVQRHILRIALVFQLATFSAVSLAHGVAWDDARETEALAENIDRAIQACGIHIAQEHKGQPDDNPLASRGMAFVDDVPQAIKELATGKLFQQPRFHRWLDVHAEIWLIVSAGQQTCRVAVSKSQWVAGVGDKLNALVQVGNFWRPMKPEEDFFPNAEKSATIRKIYTMDLPKERKIRPILTISSLWNGNVLLKDQQLIASVYMLSEK
jgi:hypothetical protein